MNFNWHPLLRLYTTTYTIRTNLLRARSNYHNPLNSLNSISTTAIFYVGIVQANGKTANAMSQLQMKCHNCNSNGTTAKTKSLKMCHVSSKAETHQISYSGAIIIFVPFTEVLHFPSHSVASRIPHREKHLSKYQFFCAI